MAQKLTKAIHRPPKYRGFEEQQGLQDEILEKIDKLTAELENKISDSIFFIPEEEYHVQELQPFTINEVRFVF